jgi:hypothetical protein
MIEAYSYTQVIRERKRERDYKNLAVFFFKKKRETEKERLQGIGMIDISFKSLDRTS